MSRDGSGSETAVTSEKGGSGRSAAPSRATSSWWSRSSSHAATIETQQYYHGLMPRDDIEPMLRRDGDFLVRRTDVRGSNKWVVSVHWLGKCRHFLIRHSHGCYFVEKTEFASLPDLIAWHRSHKEPLTADSGVRLRRPVRRQEWQLNNEQIVLGKKLGEGAFGEVHLARLVYGVNRTREAAVKTLRGLGSTKQERQAFVAEARLMRRLRHAHIVRIIGVAAQEEPIMIVMELAPGGSLLSRLRTRGITLGAGEHVRYCIDAAKGMAYLEKQQFIHRDVAARNCLLGAKDEVKMTDFGLAIDKTFYKDDRAKQVPIKWLAPETLTGLIYSTKSDVWMFGVLLWEVFSDGAEPYPGLSNQEARRRVVRSGLRMSPPAGTPNDVGALMALCWQQNPNERPSFRFILDRLQATRKTLAH